MSWRDDIKEFFPGVQFVVEATFEEKHMLWLTRHDSNVGLGHIERWVDEGMGRSPTIAWHGRGKNARPIAITIFYAYLDGVKVAFYEATSELVDYKVVQKWIYERTGHITYDRGTRWAHTDVGNFNQVMHEIDRRNGRCAV